MPLGTDDAQAASVEDDLPAGFVLSRQLTERDAGVDQVSDSLVDRLARRDTELAREFVRHADAAAVERVARRSDPSAVAIRCGRGETDL